MRFLGRPPSARVRRFAACALLAALLLAPTEALNAAPPLPAPAQVTLKGGHILRGSVVRTIKVKGKPFSVIETDFGEILAPQSEITGSVAAIETGDTFLAAEVRIVRLAGSVERRSAGAKEWLKVGPLDPEVTGQPRPRILPGDTVRTGADGQLDVMLHRDAWVRLAADTEVEFSTAAARGSLSLLRGATVQDVTGRPRGQTFRVTTPSTTLGVRGTRFGVFVDADKQGIAVLKGVVRVGASADVAEGQEGTWTDPATVTVSPLSEGRRRLLDRPALRLPNDDMALVPGDTYLVGASQQELVKKTATTDGWMLVSCTDGKYAQYAFSFAYGKPLLVTSFLIDRHEVSRKDFDLFEAAESGASPGRPETEEHSRWPALALHSQAEAFARWTGKTLPKATQWHVAARGGDARLFPWGDQRRTEHCALILGTWEGKNAGLLGPYWTPAASLPPVDAPTVDVSPFGVCAMVSSAPEWVQSRIDREPIWPALSDNFKANFSGGWSGTKVRRSPTITCGDAGSLFYPTTHQPHIVEYGVAEESMDRVGFRCVIELGGR